MSYQNLIDTGIFIKFDIREQFQKYQRTKSQDTLDWWKKQGTLPKETNLLPRDTDLSTQEGIEIFRRWFTSKPNWKNTIVWARGSLDQMAFESLLRAMDIKPIVPYYQWRDVRTAIDCMYKNNQGGYVEVDEKAVPGFDLGAVMKHHPTHDSAYDLCMLLGGKA